MPRGPRSRPSVRFTLVDRREALELALGGVAAAVLAACKGDALLDTGGALADPTAVPPITPNDDFYVTSCCGVVSLDGASWLLQISDEVGVRALLSLAQLQALGGRDKEHTLECIGSGPRNQGIGNAVWTGLPLVEILDHLGVEVPASAVQLLLTGADGYTTTVPVEDLDAPLWLVWEMNGEPLPEAHGFPARLLAPGRYGIKNPKWLVQIQFIDEPALGFWESVGWSDDATYQPNTLIAAPRQELDVQAGPLRFLGTAFAGRDPVVRVELSLDGGDTWQDCALDYEGGPDVWTLWHFDWDAAPGSWDVRVRCTTEAGATSSPDPAGTDYLQGYDGSMQVLITVS